MDAELQKELDSVIERARAMKALPATIRGQAANPDSTYEWRIKQLDLMNEQIQYMRGMLIVERRNLQTQK